MIVYIEYEYISHPSEFSIIDVFEGVSAGTPRRRGDYPALEFHLLSFLSQRHYIQSLSGPAALVEEQSRVFDMNCCFY